MVLEDEMWDQMIEIDIVRKWSGQPIVLQGQFWKGSELRENNDRRNDVLHERGRVKRQALLLPNGEDNLNLLMKNIQYLYRQEISKLYNQNRSGQFSLDFIFSRKKMNLYRNWCIWRTNGNPPRCSAWPNRQLHDDFKNYQCLKILKRKILQ